ncbi:MAG: dihydrofolate reductase [Rikenellaceae bacterium]
MINIIVAVAENNVIGCHNKLIWHISEDLKRFKSLTTGHPIIMGRKTYESIGRPLPGRLNVVITRSRDLVIEGVSIVGSLQEAVELTKESEPFVIGGGEIYAQSLPLAGRLYITRVHQSPQGDTYFPELDLSEWRETLREEREGYTFIDYERK